MDIHQFKMTKDIVAGLYGKTLEALREAAIVAVTFYVSVSCENSSFHILAKQMIVNIFFILTI